MMQLLQKSEDAVRGWLRGIDAALLRTVAAAAALCMLLAHGFAFTNLFPNHDSTVLVFDAQWTMYVLGRWAQNLYFPLVRGKIAAPWLIGAFSIVYLALTGYIIAKLLHLRRWSAALLTGLLGTCASVTAQLATYTYETDAYLLASGNVYILMQHALFLVYLVPMVLFGGSVLFPAERRTGGALVGLLCGFLILRSIICANGAYVYTKLVYDNTARQMTQIMADVGKLDGYEPGTTPVAFVGTFTDSNLTYHDPAFSRYEEGSLHQVNVAVTYDGTIKWWFQHVMGSSAAVLADQATLDAVGKKAAVQAMPNYPAQGYCAMVDGTAVIKLSD